MARAKKAELAAIPVQVRDRIGGEWRDLPISARFRINYTGRWPLGLPDTFIEVAAASDGDFLEVRSEFALSLAVLSGNLVHVSPDQLQGGATEVARLRKRQVDLVAQLNAAQDPMRKRKR